MKIIGVIFTIAWFVFWLFIGISSFIDSPKQIKRDKNFVQTQIKPSVDFVNSFKKNHNRLPTNREFYIWERNYYKDYSNDLNQKADSLTPGFGSVQYIRKSLDVIVNDQSKFKNADWKKDFAIGAWRGDWTEYYYSWNHSYDTNSYSWADGYIGLFVCFSIGLLPLISWWYFQRIRRKKQHTTQKFI